MLILRLDSAAVTAVTIAGAALYLRDSRPAVAASWDEGREQLAKWAGAVADANRTAGSEVVTALVWLLALLLPAHGAHRGEVA